MIGIENRMPVPVIIFSIAAMQEAMREAEQRLLKRFGEVTIGELSRTVARSRMAGS